MRNFYFRVIILLFIFTSSTMVLWAQEMSEKFAWTTQMFLKEQAEKVEKPRKRSRRVLGVELTEKMAKQKPQSLIASPDTIGGEAYISCFVHLKDMTDLNQLQSLGIEVEEIFDGLDFVTALVPVKQLESLAAIDNVTRIKVAQIMSPTTDVARQKTNVDELLTTSNDAISVGITDKYDGTGVVLGVIDTGIDFQHIAFKDKNGDSRIKRAYVYDGKSAQEYYTITNFSPTTDDKTQDHGTHTASTAGGSSVNVNGSTVTVTDDHSSATFGGMAPGADLYLAGVSSMKSTYLMNALKKMVEYADAQDKPLVVSNSWGSQMGPHDGTGEWADYVGQQFGDSHPNHVILFSASNDAESRSKEDEGGGYFVKKNSASSSNPLGTILRSNIQDNINSGVYYLSCISSAWCSKQMKCKIHVLDNETGVLLNTWEVSPSYSGISLELDNYYEGTLYILQSSEDSKFNLNVLTDKLLKARKITKTTKNGNDYYNSGYTLAIEVYPASGSADVNMWAGLDNSYAYFTNHLTTSGHTWMAGTYDMCVSDQATIPDAISVGAYMSKNSWENFENKTVSFGNGSSNSEDDIARFSSYATPDQSPTGLAYPWITAPGATVVAGVNHYHTTSVDDGSYFGQSLRLVVNNDSNPYGAMEGTSMATPVAAGIVALWLQAAKSVGINLTVNDVKDIMEKTAIKDSYTTGENASHFGKGKIDALAGIRYILDLAGRELRLSAAPESGTVSYLQEIKLNASESDAKIYYTFDGTEPTPQSSSLYESPLKIDHNLTLKAKAFLDGYEASKTLTETYQVKLDITADKESGNIEAGQLVTLSSKHPDATIFYTTDGSMPTKQSIVYNSPIRIDRTVTIKAIAMHDACLSSDVLTRNYIVPKLSLETSLASGIVDYLSEVGLSANASGATIYYTTDGSTPTERSLVYTKPIVISQNVTIKAKAFLDGYEASEIFTETYQVKLDITADKESGYIEAGQLITLSSKHPEAAIYYTTDGSMPTNQSLVYNSPIRIDRTVTIKAIAMHDVCLSSDVLTRNYVVTMDKLILDASMASGIVDYLSEVGLSANVSGATIYYTTDGSMPTKGSTVYTKPIVISQNVTIKAKAFLDGYEASEILTETYQAKLDITADKESGNIEAGQLVTLNCKHPEAAIYYTTDGSMPTKQSIVYNSPIRIDRTVTIKAIAMHDACLSSDVLTRNYNYVVPEITDISISPSELELICGQNVQLSYSYAPVGAVISSLTWESSASDVAAINQYGLVTAFQPGHATLTVTTHNGITGKCELTVINPRLRFYVWLRNGEWHVYDIGERPEISLNEEEKKIILTTASQTLEYNVIDILNFTLQEETVEKDWEDGVSIPKAMEDVQFREGALSLAHCSPNMPVYIYDTAGKIVQTAVTDGNGCLSLSLSSLRAGIYILKTGTITTKIQKR